MPGAPRLRRLGSTEYMATWEAMRAFTAARDPATPDELWLTAHPSVYTVGIAGRAEHLPRADNGIAVVRTDRGGQVTWHGPGQVILYTLLDLARLGLGVRPLVRLLEDSVVAVLAAHGVAARGDRHAPGVYVDGAKVAALGLRVRQGRCYHGLALNVDPDLSAFEAIDPCGHPGLPVTSTRRLGIGAPEAELGEALATAVIERLRP
ncbi:MAG: lipoyl(octanoyl) transferase LipB [Betaproteobacteria bacterium]